MSLDDGFELPRNFIESLVPGYFLELITYFLERMFQSICVVLIVGDFQTLATTVPFAARVFFVRANLDDPVLFDRHFQSTVLSATHTACLLPRCHVSLLNLRLGDSSEGCFSAN
jgi:hypothetical protein